MGQVANGIILPTVKTPVSRNWQDQKFGMIGMGGIGKSGFWAQGERTLFIETEAGLNFLEVMRVPARSWAEFREIVIALVTAAQGPDPFPYDTIVVDTIDRLISMANEEVISWANEKFGKSGAEFNTVGDIPNGSGWFRLNELLERTLTTLERLPAAIVWIGHVQTKKIEEPGRKPYDRDTINFGGKMGGLLLHWTDHTLHVQAHRYGETMKRVVRTRPTQAIEAKSRGDVVPDGWEWGQNAAENYAKLRSLFQVSGAKDSV